MKNVAVILCGSGYRDGSEIRESVATLWALSQERVHVQCFAPNAFQTDVVNCLTGEPVTSEKRNMLVEAARIARGEIKPLDQLNVSDFDALIIPGGFGAAKNLCDFAFKGSQGTTRPDLEKILQMFFEKKKPIGAICIAPAILALALRGKNLSLTVGSSGETAQEIEKCGHQHVSTKVTDCHVDTKNKIVTTGAYMFGSAPLHEVFSGIQKCVQGVLKLTV
ncbi:isoprenoid biosynthesis protein ElbB [bacterium]|nr:isoprenoid biosynthesis protein ElbB [bacterium]